MFSISSSSSNFVMLNSPGYHVSGRCKNMDKYQLNIQTLPRFELLKHWLQRRLRVNNVFHSYITNKLWEWKCEIKWPGLAKMKLFVQLVTLSANEINRNWRCNKVNFAICTIPFLWIRSKAVMFCRGNYAFSSKAISKWTNIDKLSRQDLSWQVMAISRINKKPTGNFTVQATICNVYRSNTVLYTCSLSFT